MGEIADDVISGAACSWCGVYFTEEHGYPVICKGCWRGSEPEERADMNKAIYHEI